MVELIDRPLITGAANQNWILSGRLAEDGEHRSISLFPLPFRIGRRPGLPLTLTRQTVSGTHAEFFVSGNRVFLQDLGSTNGTFVNGVRITEPHPLAENDLIQFADLPFRASRTRTEIPSSTRCTDSRDQALAMVQFDNLMQGRGLIPFYQPIVDLSTGRLEAFEVLARSRLIGLESPEFMFNAATQLGAATDLSRIMRRIALEDSCLFNDQPHLFLNTHPSELTCEGLLDSCIALRSASTNQRITIEIHEAALTNVEEMVALRAGLEAVNITLAFDDFGAGQARIAELAEVRPHYVKFDRSLIRNLEQADLSRKRVVSGLVSMVRDIGIIPLAEGVETAGEVAACLDLGFVQAQGYFFGRPMPVSHYLQAELNGTGNRDAAK